MRRHFAQVFPVVAPMAMFLLVFWRFSSLEISGLISLCLAGSAALLTVFVMPAMENKHTGGKRLLSPAEAVQEARRVLARDYPSDRGFRLWDLVRAPSEYKSTGIFIMGGMGSGKSVYLTCLIAEALRDNPQARLVIHDYKMELHPFLTRQLGIPDRDIKILHPFDRRCCGWDLQADIVEEGNAESLATALIPEPPAQVDRFWTNNARHIVTAAILFFFFQGEEDPNYRWNLRALVDLLEDEAALKEIINQDQRLRFARHAINRANNEMLANISAEVGGLRRIASLWDFPDKERISLRQWREEAQRKILILGSDPREKVGCRALNRLLWMQLKNEALRNDLPPSETWFFLDEFYAMSRLDEIEEFSSVSRSCKANLALVTQDIAQVEELYGKNKLSILMQGMKTQVYFRCSGNASQWAAAQIGEQKILKESSDRRVSSGSVTTGTGLREEKERLLMAEDLQRLQKCTSERPLLEAVISTFLDDPFRYTMGFEAFRHIWPVPQLQPDYQRETRRERTRPRPLSHEERQALGLPLEKLRDEPDDQNALEFEI